MAYSHFPEFTPDANLQLKDAGLVAADAAWQVGGANKIIDLWPSGVSTFQPFDVWIQVTACEIASNDELYRLHVQVSSSATFASVIHSVSILELGALEVKTGTQDQDTTDGTNRFHLRCHNDVNGTPFRYLRGYTDVAGTIATGINFQAWASLVNL